MNTQIKQLNIFDFVNDNFEQNQNKAKQGISTIVKPKEFINNDSQEELARLMQKKFGINKTSLISQSRNDDLYKLFKKLAKYIYTNGFWAITSYLEAADTLFPVLGFLDKYAFTSIKHPILDNYVKISGFVDHTECDKSGIKANEKSSYSYTLKLSTFINDKYSRYIVLSNSNKDLVNTGTLYYLKREPDKNFTYISKELLIGYSKLYSDLKKFYMRTPVDSRPTEESFYRLLRGLVSGTKSEYYYLHYKKAYQTYIASKDPETQKRVEAFAKLIHLSRKSFDDDMKALDFVANYLHKTFNIIMMQQKESDLESLSHAKAWQTKKNPNTGSIHASATSILNKWFGKIEIDNDVDLIKFSEFENSVKDSMEYLPKADIKPTLRLRKIANHKAIGLYFPQVNNIVVDFRDARQRGHFKGRSGISSFIHEYGHYLDYKYKVNLRDNIKLPWSMQESFRPILNKVNDNLRLIDTNSYVANKLMYYTTPTEVFARSFELYMLEKGHASQLLINQNDVDTLDEYKIIRNGNIDNIVTYFNTLFAS